MQPPIDDNNMNVINAYLDGLLSVDELAAFEARLAEDQDLRQHVDWQRSIQQRLKASVNLDQLRESIRSKVETNASPLQHAPQTQPEKIAESAKAAPIFRIQTLLYAGLAAAAAVVISVAISEYTDQTAPSGRVYPELLPISPATAYDSLVAGGFKPYEVCTREEIPDWTEKKLGLRLAARELPSDVVLVGWTYGYYINGILLGNDAGILLSRVEDREVVVIIDHKDHDRDLTQTGSEIIQGFRSELGDLVLYEFTPFAEARILPLLMIASDQ